MTIPFGIATFCRIAPVTPEQSPPISPLMPSAISFSPLDVDKLLSMQPVSARSGVTTALVNPPDYNVIGGLSFGLNKRRERLGLYSILGAMVLAAAAQELTAIAFPIYDEATAKKLVAKNKEAATMWSHDQKRWERAGRAEGARDDDPGDEAEPDALVERQHLDELW